MESPADLGALGPVHHVFIVRIWREPGLGEPSWRATVKDLESGLAVSSTDLNDIEDFIRLRIDKPEDEPDTAAPDDPNVIPNENQDARNRN